MTIAFVRHGQTEWNRIGRVQGVTDIPLNDTGRQQALETAHSLAEEERKWSLITSSPLSRARETAQIIADHLEETLGDPVEALREQNYGVAEGVSIDEFNARWPNREFEGGESSEQLADRALRVLDHLDQAEPNGHVLAVSHGALIRRLISVVADVDYHDIPAIENSALTILEKDQDGQWQVVLINNEPVERVLPQPPGLVTLNPAGSAEGTCTVEGVCS